MIAFIGEIQKPTPVNEAAPRNDKPPDADLCIPY